MKRILAVLAIAAVHSSAFAIMGFLADQSVNGTLRYCKYSNGVIITISSTELCPLTIGQ